jgi:hypothetical protein
LNFVRIIHITHFQFRNRNYRSASKSNKNPLTRSRLVSHILVDTAVTQRPTHPLTLRPRSISSDRHVGVDRSASLPRCRGWHDVSPRHASHLSSPVHAMSLTLRMGLFLSLLQLLSHCTWARFIQLYRSPFSVVFHCRWPLLFPSLSTHLFLSSPSVSKPRTSKEKRGKKSNPEGWKNTRRREVIDKQTQRAPALTLVRPTPPPTRDPYGSPALLRCLRAAAPVLRRGADDARASVRPLLPPPSPLIATVAGYRGAGGSRPEALTGRVGHVRWIGGGPCHYGGLRRRFPLCLGADLRGTWSFG